MRRAVKTWIVAGFLLLGDTGLAFADEAKPMTRMSRDLASLPERQRADVTGLGPPATSNCRWTSPVIG